MSTVNYAMHATSDVRSPAASKNNGTRGSAAEMEADIRGYHAVGTAALQQSRAHRQLQAAPSYPEAGSTPPCYEREGCLPSGWAKYSCCKIRAFSTATAGWNSGSGPITVTGPTPDPGIPPVALAGRFNPRYSCIAAQYSFQSCSHRCKDQPFGPRRLGATGTARRGSLAANGVRERSPSNPMSNPA
jgi:hypothetical protein